MVLMRANAMGAGSTLVTWNVATSIHTLMSLQQLWVPNGSHASSSTDHFAVDVAIKALYVTPRATKAINFMVLM